MFSNWHVLQCCLLSANLALLQRGHELTSLASVSLNSSRVLCDQAAEQEMDSEIKKAFSSCLSAVAVFKGFARTANQLLKLEPHNSSAT